MPVAQTEILIQAPIEKVWAAMTNLAGYPQWNSFVRKVESDDGAALGSTLRLFVFFHHGKTVESVERITRLEPPQRLASGATLEYEFLGPLSTFCLVRGKRLQTLEAIDAQTARYFTYEICTECSPVSCRIHAVQKGFETHTPLISNGSVRWLRPPSFH